VKSFRAIISDRGSQAELTVEPSVATSDGGVSFIMLRNGITYTSTQIPRSVVAQLVETLQEHLDRTEVGSIHATIQERDNDF
jgi:hypothetical protein